MFVYVCACIYSCKCDCVCMFPAYVHVCTSFTIILPVFHLLLISNCSDCGCGSGEGGCTKCGACQICTGDPLPDKHSLMTYITSTDLDVVAVYEKGRERIKDLKEKEQGQKKEKKEKKKKKKKAKASSESPPPPPPPPLPPVLSLVNPSVPPPIPPHVPLVPKSLQSQTSIASESGLKLLFGCK